MEVFFAFICRSIPPLEALARAASDIACSYACLLLRDDGIPITADKISTVVNAAGVPIESYWLGLFSKLVQKISIDDLLINVESGGGGAPVAVTATASGAGAGPAAAAAPTAEEKKEEPKEESDDDMGFSLFD